jgi:hypothetical protein
MFPTGLRPVLGSPTAGLSVVGLERIPLAMTLGGPRNLPPGAASLLQASDSKYRDARRDFARASFWWTMSSFVTWVTNELNPNKVPRITQTSPRIWWNNLEAGFKWDDNTFTFNQIAHPVQGALYYNSFRNHGFPFWAGGLRFWESAVFYTLLGSVAWECCGESQLASLNDLITTTIGGAALGEMTYRTSSWILDDTTPAFNRDWRETASGILNPLRFFDRLLTRHLHLMPVNNARGAPEEPPESDYIAAAGWRSLGDGADRQGAAFLEAGWRRGSLLMLDDTIQNKPYALFSVATEVNLGDEDAPLIPRAQIEGSLYFWDVEGRPGPAEQRVAEQDPDTATLHKLLLLHNLDYFENSAFRYGAQSLGLSLFSNFQRGPFLWRSQLGGDMAILAAIKSEEAWRADIEGYQEQDRHYDFTMGPGVRGKVGIALAKEQGEHRRFIDLSYQYHRLFTLNGSNGPITESGTNGGYWDSWHGVHVLGARVKLLDVSDGAWGVDLDYLGFWRRSTFTNPEIPIERQVVHEHIPQFRIMVTWEERRLRGTPDSDVPGPIYLPPSIPTL